ncbi:DEAD-domain-containing protein [Neocallimastix lanati (nom. inval.)]|jgi:ATP-dependent RNA helicase DDX21|nr:DEAD-domain-containing protein [Neocallimastix sp. JGI-2020a]
MKPILDGFDVLGRARTGTGKTLAFCLPMVQTLINMKNENPGQFHIRRRAPKILVMAPTRELASQSGKELEYLCGKDFEVYTIYGGVPYDPQINAISKGLDAVVGTPGRIIDHIERGSLKLHDLQFLVMDEADQMLDIGFAEYMDKVLQMVQEQKKEVPNAPVHQTLLFSATVPDWVNKAIKKYMRPNMKTIDLVGSQKLKTSETVNHYAIPSTWQNRSNIIGDIVAVYGKGNDSRTIIFVETKSEANELALNDKLKSYTQVIHGDIVQKQREITLKGFRDGKFKCLIATNVMARGLDIPEVDLVINCEPPSDIESYIHRSGRTGRAGRSGTCVTFYKQSQEYMLNIIQKKTGLKFTMVSAPQPSDIIAAQASNMCETLSQEISPQVLNYFKDTAKELLERYNGDAINSISACIAYMCNTTKPLSSRSLMSSEEGYVTLFFKIAHEIRNPGYIRSMFDRRYPGINPEFTRRWRMCKDSRGVVVDLDEKKVEYDTNEDGTATNIRINKIEWHDSETITLEIPKTLPELMESHGANSTASFGYNNNGGRSFGGNRGGDRGRSSYGGNGNRGGDRGRSSSFGGRSSSFGGRSSSFGGSSYGNRSSFSSNRSGSGRGFKK